MAHPNAYKDYAARGKKNLLNKKAGGVTSGVAPSTIAAAARKKEGQKRKAKIAARRAVGAGTPKSFPMYPAKKKAAKKISSRGA